MRGHFAKDLTGKRFGNLTVISRAPNRIRNGRINAYWICRCDCGKEKEIRGTHLKSGKIISCGCIGRIHNIEARIKHNQAGTRLYYVWCDMKNRCYNKNIRSYKNYGAEGVTVCDEWLHDFGAFSKWAFSNGYDPEAEYGKCTIDRIDVYGNYCPDNCRWVDAKTQANNRRMKSMAESC